jgi:hypothetical protein
MAEVFESVIKIDTGDSEQSVKGLKKEIGELRDYILKLDAGTDEYAEAVGKLQEDQRKLNEVMSLTKREAVALDGSYDALVHKMSLLKKEWRATNDEARRNELGQQIAEINQQLKGFDASLGNFQREVGHYENAMNGMGGAVQDFGTAMRESMQSVEPVKARFESVRQIASGLASGFAAVQGAAALLGVENEDLERTFVKLQASMAIAQGIGGLGDLVEGLGKAKVAFKGLGSEIKVISKAIGKAGWIGLVLTAVTAIGALTAKLIKNNKEAKDGTKAYKEYNSALGETFKTGAENASDAVTELMLYQRIATDTTRSDDERRKAAGKLLETLGEAKTETNILNVLNGDYKTKVDDVTAALIKQAQAEAMLEKIKERQAEIIAKQSDLAVAEANLTEAKANQVIRPVTSSGTAGPTTTTPGTNVGDAERIVKQTQQELDQLKADFNVWVENFTKDFSLEEIIPDNGGGNGGGKEKVKEKVMTQAEALALAYKQSMELLDEELENMPEIELPEVEMNLPEDGEMKKRADIAIQMAERVANRERELNAATDQDAEAKAQNDYKINLKLQQDKLAILQKYYDNCTGDAESLLELEQMIADQKTEIQRVMYEEWDRLREKNKQNDLARIDSFKDGIEDFKESWDDLDPAGKISTISQVTAAAFGAMGDIFSQAADMHDKEGEMSEKEMKKVKNLRIAGAIMDMLSGVVGAVSSVAGAGPVGWAMGAIQAAAITATGIMNITKIKNTDLNGGGGQTPSLPAQSTYASELPVTYTRQVTGASEVEELNRDQRVYILESDIQASNRRVEVRESESSF